jgi:hypothetical protein
MLVHGFTAEMLVELVRGPLIDRPLFRLLQRPPPSLEP